MKPRLLITGVTGLLGSALTSVAGRQYRVYGVARQPSRGGVLPAEMFPVDILDRSRLTDLMARVRPDVVVHTAALASVDGCERDPEWARRLNVDGTRNVLQALGGHACTFVLISTDSVFDGVRGDYGESDPPAPVHVYGRTKLEAEELALSVRPGSLVVRTAFFGRNVLPQESLAEWILRRLRAGLVVPSFVDVRFSPVLTTHLARAVLSLASKSASGIVHVGSPRGCSKYEFATSIAASAGFSTARVVPTTITSMALEAPRPRNVTLVSERAAAVLGSPLPDFEQGVQEFLAS